MAVLVVFILVLLGLDVVNLCTVQSWPMSLARPFHQLLTLTLPIIPLVWLFVAYVMVRVDGPLWLVIGILMADYVVGVGIFVRLRRRLKANRDLLRAIS